MTAYTQRTRATTWEPLLWVAAAIGVWLTVGWIAALLALSLIIADRVIRPDDRVLATAAVVLLVLVPITWFLGSTLPLFPASTRLNDNLVAHHVGGLAVWTLFLAACVEVRPRESDSA